MYTCSPTATPSAPAARGRAESRAIATSFAAAPNVRCNCVASIAVSADGISGVGGACLDEALRRMSSSRRTGDSASGGIDQVRSGGFGSRSSAIAGIASSAPDSSGLAAAAWGLSGTDAALFCIARRRASRATNVSFPGVRCASSLAPHARSGAPVISVSTRVNRPTSGSNRPPRAAIRVATS